MPEMHRVQVAHVSLDAPLEPIVVDEDHDHVLLVASLGRRVIGEIVVPAGGGVLSIAAQREAIIRELADPLWRRRLALDFTQAARDPAALSAPLPLVSVIVCPTEPADGLPALLDGLRALDPPAHEVIVVGRGEAVRAECERRQLPFLEEPDPALARARNRGVLEATGEVVAFLEDDWRVDSAWLEGIGLPFEDGLVMAVKGYVAGEAGSVEVKVHDRIGSLQVPRFAEGNSFIRRNAFARVGPFAESLGPGLESEFLQRLFAAGWRVVAAPSHVSWRLPSKHPRRVAFSRGMGIGAYVTHTVFSRRDLSVLPTPRSWRSSRLPLPLRISKALGTIAGPWSLMRSRLGRRGVEPLPPPVERPAESLERETRPPSVVTEADPPLSVAIASYNRREPLARLLETFADQSYPRDRFEIVVVVDGSTDGTAERARTLDLPYRLRVFEQENRGLAASRNRGAREATAPVVVFIDDDMAPERDFLVEHAGAHARADRPVAALGSCPPANPGDDLASLALRHWWEDYYRRRSEPDHQWSYTDFGDGNMSLPRSSLDAAGGWDEEFAKETVRRQDWELAIRLIKGGMRFVDCPEARAWHHFEVNLGTSMRNRRVEGRADVLLGLKHPDVREHLFLRRYIVDEKGRRRQYRPFALHPAGWQALVDLGASTAQLLEKVQMRWVAWKSMLRMLSYSYLIGVREALPTEEQFQDFVGPMLRHELVETVPVELDRAGVLDLAPATGGVDLLLEYAGRQLGRVDAFEPEVQWDWDTLTDRVVSETLDSYRAVAGEPMPLTADVARSA